MKRNERKTKKTKKKNIMEFKDELVAVIKTERRYTCDSYTHPLWREKKKSTTTTASRKNNK